MPIQQLANPKSALSNSTFTDYTDEVSRTVIPLETAATVTGNMPVTFAMDGTGRCTPSVAGSVPGYFIGIVDQKRATAAAGDVVNVVTYGIVKDVPSSGTILAGQVVAMSATTGTVVEATSIDGVPIGVCTQTAASNRCHVFVGIGPGFLSAGGQGYTGGSFQFPINLASITGAGDVITNFTPGFSGTIAATSFIMNQPVTTASRAVTLNLEINTTNVTGGEITLTSATATPMGKVYAGAAVTFGNVFDVDDTLSVEASSVTAFAEGSGTLVIHYR